MTAAHRAAWFAAGVAATVAGLAALAVHWGRAAARTEGYGTWQRQGGDQTFEIDNEARQRDGREPITPQRLGEELAAEFDRARRQ